MKIITERRLVAWLRGVLKTPWLIAAKEAWIDRHAAAGDLRLHFMDIRRPPRRDPEALATVISGALQKLSDAGQGFGELVTSHLRTVVATDYVGQDFVLGASAWGSTFRDQARDNSYVLACQLIWAAAAIRLARDAKAAGRPTNRAAIREACWAAQQRFLRQFEDADYWIEYMDPDRAPGAEPTDGAA